MQRLRIAALLVGSIGLALAGCTGPAGPAGPSGAPCTITANGDGTSTIACPGSASVTVKNGTDGNNGTDGTSCSVTDNGNGTKTISCTDGTTVTVSDGTNGNNGTNGTNGTPGNFGLTIDSVVTAAGADGGMVSTLTFSVYPAANVCPGGVCDDGLSSAVVGTKAFYTTEYNPTTNTFDTAKNFSFGGIHFQGFTSDGRGATYTATKANPSFTPETSSSAMVFAYVTGKAAAPAPEGSHYLLPTSVASASKVYGTINFVSNANVSGCEKCHGAPYAKHGYRMAAVAGLPTFAACKNCHTDQRVGGHADWFMIADDPANYEAVLASNNGTLPAAYKAKYAYRAKLMNDVHNAHAFEFNYPQSMSNCATCHEGKLANILTDSNFKPTVCKSCHPVNGPTPLVGNGGVERGRAPAITAIWAAKGQTMTHQSIDLYGTTDGGVDNDPAACNTCHKSGGIAKTFAELHSGYNPAIYDSTGAKWADSIKTSIDSTSYDSSTHVVTVDFSVSGAAANAMIKPTVVGSLYGWDTKDFLVSGHSSVPAGTLPDGGTLNLRALEYTEGATNNGPRLTVNPSTTTAGTTSWTATADLSMWAAALPDGGPGLITSGAVKRMQLSVIPAVGLDQSVFPGNGMLPDGGANPEISISGATATITLVANGALAAGDVDPNGYGLKIVDPAKCDSCHDRLGTTFHAPKNGSAGTPVCRSCHFVGAGGFHLEMQSRSIDSYIHAIHSMQYFDIQNVDFTDPVQKLRYGDHIEGNFPNFAGALNCEACHFPGTYNVPDQTRSLPSIISAARPLKPGSTRNIGAVPAQITGPAERACGGCHRAHMINEDNAGELGAFYAHTTVNGSSVMDTSDSSLDATDRYIMGLLGVSSPAPYVPGAQVESCGICHPEQGEKHQALFDSWKAGLP